jgi:FMN phosphatase YigB (HAD superfamily)
LSTSLTSAAAAVAVLPPWEAIDTVLLDMDGTLLDLRFDNYFWMEFLPERYAERHGLTPEQARAVLRSMLLA